MKIVMEFEWGGYEASGTETLALEGPDLETLYCQFEDAVKAAKEHRKSYFKLWGYEFETSNFFYNREVEPLEDGPVYTPPEFYELEDWYNKKLGEFQACHE